MHPNTEGILESSLYVIDVAHSVQFYKKIFGFQVISDFGERGCAMRAGSRQVLLLFKKGGSRDMVSQSHLPELPVKSGFRQVHSAAGFGTS